MQNVPQDCKEALTFWNRTILFFLDEMMMNYFQNKNDLSKQQKDEQKVCHVRYVTKYYQKFLFSRVEHSPLLADAVGMQCMGVQIRQWTGQVCEYSSIWPKSYHVFYYRN